jgi:hypothetical protein
MQESLASGVRVVQVMTSRTPQDVLALRAKNVEEFSEGKHEGRASSF